MSKIGDLFVRLGLKSDDYKKGLNDAKKQTSSFGTSLKNMKAGALAVWAAIGTAVIAFGKQVLSATNRIGDAWDTMTAGLKAGWDTFVQSLSNFDFNNFVGKFKEAKAAAEELQSVLDAQFEGKNSIALQRAMMSEELAALRIAMRDQNKSNEERLAAAKQYMDKVKPIYEQEIRLAKELMDAQAGKWLAGTDIKDSEAARNDLMKFLVDYGKDKGLASKIANYLKMDEGASRKALWQDINAYGKQNGYTNYITDLAEIYEKWRGDKDTQPLVEAIINAYNAKAGLNEDTRMVQTIENSISAAIRKEQDDLKAAEEALAQEVLNVRAETLKTFESDMAKLDKAIEAMNNAEIEIEIPEIDLSALEIADATIQEFIGNFQAELEEIAALNQMLSDTIASSISGGVQAFTEMLFDLDNADPSQILSALMQPFAQTAIQLGEMLIAQGVAIEAFNSSFRTLKGAPAIAAGAALVAIGAAMSAGIKALAGGGASGTTSASTYDSGSYSSDGYDTYESNIVVEVVGKISGSDILIAGSKQQNKWNR